MQERLKTDLDGLGFFDKGEIVKIERRGDGYYKNPVFKDFQANLTVIFQIHIEYGSHDDDVWNVEMLLDGRGVSERRLYSDTGGYYPQYDYKIRSIKIAPVKKGFFLR